MQPSKVYKHSVYGFPTLEMGWSWPAFLFDGIWAFSGKLWLFGSGILAAIVRSLTCDCLQYSEPANLRVIQRVFCRRIRRVVPLLQNGNAQHLLHPPSADVPLPPFGYVARSPQPIAPRQ